MMTELVEWLKVEQEINPVLIAGIAQFQLVHIYPFLDGNGRSARLLSTLYLYPVIVRKSRFWSKF
jgi:Fic family protein